MKRMNDACDEWKAETNIGFALYGTPLESTTYKFAKCLQQPLRHHPGVTDKGYITNSYHVHVTEQIDAFDKLNFESQFQRISTGGAISYVEVPNMQHNLEAVCRGDPLHLRQHHVRRAEHQERLLPGVRLRRRDQIVEDDGKLIWECPKCHNTDQDKMNVARRTCGYIGTQFWNQGRTKEIKERVLHL